MLPNSDDLEIQHLADETGVTVRTIRFYQHEGLMPAPGTRGKAFLYGEADINRLRLIKALQRERLTLAEIRDRLAPMDETEVAGTLSELERSRKSAADYARAVRLSAEREPAGPSAGGSVRPVPGRSIGRSRGSWERITLTPDIELHVRSPLSHHETKLVSRLVELADRLINTGEGL